MRHRLGSRHPRVLPDRHGALRPRPRRRVRRAASTSRCASGRATSSRRVLEKPGMTRERASSSPTTTWACAAFRCCSSTASTCASWSTHRDDPARTSGSRASRRSRASTASTSPHPRTRPRPRCSRGSRRSRPTSSSRSTTAACSRPRVLATARRGAYNMHGSLLPKYRGRAPVNWAVLKGERETGATLHEMVGQARRGRHRRPAGRARSAPNDTAIEVFARVTAAAEQVLRRALPTLLDGTARARPAGPRGAAATSAGAGPRTGASTGPGPRARSTTWSARWPLPTPAPSRACAGEARAHPAHARGPRRRRAGRRPHRARSRSRRAPLRALRRRRRARAARRANSTAARR